MGKCYDVVIRWVAVPWPSSSQLKDEDILIPKRGDWLWRQPNRRIISADDVGEIRPSLPPPALSEGVQSERIRQLCDGLSRLAKRAVIGFRRTSLALIAKAAQGMARPRW